MASILSGLQFAQHSRAAGPSISDKQIRLRARLTDALRVQIDFVQHEIAGTTYVVRGKRRVAGEDGTTTLVERDVRTARWHFKFNQDYYVALRYGSSPMAISDQGTAILAGPGLPDVLDLYNKLLEAIAAGEVDEALERSAAGRARKGAVEVALVPEEPAQAPEEPAQASTVGKQLRGRNKG